MNALLQPIAARALVKPTYARWDLLKTNEVDAWVRANCEALMAWYSDTNRFADRIEPFEKFAREQFAWERDFLEQLRDDAKLDDCYREVNE